jgi:uncharacterized membrane protein
MSVGAAGVLIHRLVPSTSPWMIGVVIAQVTFAAWLIAGQVAKRHRSLLTGFAGTAIAMAILWLGLPARTLGLVMAGVCHALAYCGLLLWFGASLRPGREPVVSGFARRMRPSMPPDVVRYTRRVTAAWCVFFAGQIAVSLALLLAAPVDIWSDFVTIWNLPLVLAMILAEFICRTILFRHHQRTGLVATLTALCRMRDLPGSPS